MKAVRTIAAMIISLATFVALLVWAAKDADAQAFVCPYATIGWSQTWPGQPLSSAAWDGLTQLLYVVLNNQAIGYSNVPMSVIQAFTYNPNPMAVYQTYVLGTYHPILLAEKTNCPLLWETGAYLWSQ